MAWHNRPPAGALLAFVVFATAAALFVAFYLRFEGSELFYDRLPMLLRILPYFLIWSVALGVSQVLTRGEAGQQTLFVLPALLFTLAMVIFPTLFGLYIAFTNWNLNGASAHHFNGLDNLITLWNDSYFWNALGNMVFYVAWLIGSGPGIVGGV